MKSRPKPKFKLWLSTDDAEGVFGDGKWRLLKEIEQRGSLKAAAAAFGMSYRTAWGDLKKAEKYLGVALVTRYRGGSAGGGTTVTRHGQKWLAAYARFRRDVETAVRKAYAKRIRTVVTKEG